MQKMIQIDERYVIDTMRDLVRIESTNPSLSDQGSGEAQIARAIAGMLEKLGIPVELQETAGGRPNVIGRLRGSGNGRTLLLNGHMDTVGLEGMSEPLSGRIEGDRLFGRGAQDMKGALAAMLGAAKGLIDNRVELGGDLLLAFVVDEEALSIGSAELVKRYQADAAIVTEPTDLTIGRAHRGFIWFDIETYGRAAHGSRYSEGVDANLHMGRVLAALDGLEKELRSRPGHDLAGPPSLHAAVLRGGSERSIYAAHCLLQLERRTIPGESVASTTAELQAILDTLAAADPSFRATVKPAFDRHPFEIDASAAIVRAVEQASAARLGRSAEHTGQTFWTDAALLAEAGMDALLLGPKGQGLHSAEEWVSIRSVLDLAGILVDTAIAYCAARTA